MLFLLIHILFIIFLNHFIEFLSIHSYYQFVIVLINFDFLIALVNFIKMNISITQLLIILNSLLYQFIMLSFHLLKEKENLPMNLMS